MTFQEFSKETKERISFKTTGKIWRKVRNISAAVASGSAITLVVLPDGELKTIVGIICGLSTTLSFRSHIDKSNKK